MVFSDNTQLTISQTESTMLPFDIDQALLAVEIYDGLPEDGAAAAVAQAVERLSTADVVLVESDPSRARLDVAFAPRAPGRVALTVQVRTAALF